jgi:hypothetical protein
MSTSPTPDQTPAHTDAQADEIAGSVGDIDQILEKWTDRQDAFASKEDEAMAEEEKFLNDFREISGRVIKPAMEANVQRLQKDGGDGMIWDGESEAMHRPSVILWMSLKGKIDGPPRQDLNPYLQLDVDTPHRRIDIWEGDMWENSGVSRATTPWHLTDISTESVNRRVMGILDRATNHAEPF